MTWDRAPARAPAVGAIRVRGRAPHAIGASGRAGRHRDPIARP
ncbi:hypothetical protein FM110_03435 [Brachybacterium nesterenkovii]|uniref:Uncharacterized protein n=1 Tax=Brachybacterium nesterenkovii TaxID=47847 RepID=A0A1X6WXB0_9MICO|nr:hypothetical protein FM110_03435 [Brachybacterium nesterenkovii]